jgi:hypothetical protein
VLLEHGERGHPIREAAVQHIETIHTFLKKLAQEEGVRDADGFARQWLMLMAGCIIAAYAGDLKAALRAKEVAASLLARESGKGRQT